MASRLAPADWTVDDLDHADFSSQHNSSKGIIKYLDQHRGIGIIEPRNSYNDKVYAFFLFPEDLDFNMWKNGIMEEEFVSYQLVPVNPDDRHYIENSKTVQNRFEQFLNKQNIAINVVKCPQVE